MAKALLFDSTLCVGCRECEKTCSERWKLPYNDKIAAEENTSAHKLTAVRTHGERFSRKLCLHCVDPACVSACPVTALQKTAAGPVVYHASRCMGCRYCMIACAFGVPAYEWNSRIPAVRKCDMCSDRVPGGEASRCSEVCPAGATITGERDALIAEAKKRLQDSPGGYHPAIYGIEEAGGTSVFVLGAVPFNQLGYRTDVLKSPLPTLTWSALQHIPNIVAVGGVLLGGVYWITHRREEVAREEGGR